MKYILKFLLQFAIVFMVLIAAGIFDIILSIIGEIFRGYSYAAFIVIFGVAGIFAAVFTLSPPELLRKETVPQWVVLVFNLIIGLLYIFPFARLEAGQYAPAFRALGIMLLAASVFSFGLIIQMFLAKSQRKQRRKGTK